MTDTQQAAGKPVIDRLMIWFVWLVVGASVFAIGMGLAQQFRLKSVDRHWYEDKAGFDQALAEHNKTGKPMVVYFYAPWCPHCKLFQQVVLDTPPVVMFLGNYIKVRVYPDKGPETILLKQFRSNGFPTFFVKYKDSPKYYRIDRHGDGPEGNPSPEGFIQQLKDAEAGKISISLIPDFNSIPEEEPMAGQMRQPAGGSGDQPPDPDQH